MIPLTLANIGEEITIQRVGGNPEMRKHLADLGFVTGGNIKIISSLKGNLIVGLKSSRLAISKEMASKIMV